MFTGDYSTGNAVLIPAQEFVKGMRGQVVIPESELASMEDKASRELLLEDSESAYWRIHE